MATVPVACQFLLYTTDAVTVTYTDKSRLELSPCATTLVHTSSLTEGQHPLHGSNEVKQRTEFVTSSFKQKTIEAIDFRNRFAERPFLVGSLVAYSENIPFHRCTQDVAWPGSLKVARTETLQDGSICLHSQDRRASLILASSLQLLTLKYMAKVMGKCQDITDNAIVGRQVQSSTKDGEATKNNEGSQPHSWVIQHHSVTNPPKFLLHPISLLMELVKSMQESSKKLEKSPQKVQFRDQVKESPDTSVNITDEEKLSLSTEAENVVDDQAPDLPPQYVMTAMPQSLSVTCERQHLHQWQKTNMSSSGRQAPSGGRIKALCSKGILFRLFWKSPRSLEIYPGDGSVLRSKGLVGHYFQHFMSQNGQVTDLVYSVKTPPPDKPGQAYSIQSLLSTGASLMEHLCSGDMACDDSQLACWKLGEPQTLLPSQPYTLEMVSVPGLGRFLAQSSGLVRVTYTDRTCVEMWADFSPRIKQHQEYQHCHHKPQGKGALPEACSLLLPSGHYHTVMLTNPGKYTNYTKPAVEWVMWVNTCPSERGQFYKDTLYDPECTSRISAELNRIKCFNYIVENQVIPNIKGSGFNRSLSPTEFAQSECTLPDASMSTVDYPFFAVKSEQAGSHNVKQYEPLSQGNSNVLDMAAVHEALKATSQAVNDLDSFITLQRHGRKS